DLGGDVAGDPSMLFNPRFDTSEAYVRTGAGHVAYRYWNNGWSDWIDLGPFSFRALGGDPEAPYNPRLGITDVFARSAIGQVPFRSYANGWSDVFDLNGDIAGTPAPFYNPRYGTGEVYGNSAGSAMYRYYDNALGTMLSEDWADNWIGLA